MPSKAFFEDYVYSSSQELDGFFHRNYKNGFYLKRFYAVADVYKSTIENAFDGSTTLFHTPRKAGNYLIFTLANGSMTITDFAIKPRADTYNTKAFSFEGSENGYTWIVLHSINNNNLCSSTNVYHASISRPEKFKFFRVLQTEGRCGDEMEYLNFQGVDIYGRYNYNTEYEVVTCKIDKLHFNIEVLCFKLTIIY